MTRISGPLFEIGVHLWEIFFWQYEATISLHCMYLCMYVNNVKIFFYRCTVHLDNVKIPFYQQMHPLLNIQKVKIYIKMSYIRSYTFRSVWTILRELTLSLSKVTLL